MKKLLSALFILGSVTMLANEATTLPADVDPAFCFNNPCSADAKFDVKVKVPQKLVITAGELNIGLWCGDKAKDYEKENHFTVTGEPGETITVGFKNDGDLLFTASGALPFTGTIETLKDSLELVGGTAKGGVKVHIPQPKLNTLKAGTTYTAHATLVAAYDTKGF
ncbi:hypothetical protein H5J22_05375 [Cetobacterium sp. 8H]|uniref:hypothetical protein n=1 Tax=Cetobacterium sp. 8H TaxID=2759681 RepID=UPI00163C18E8|nr:hypothetical protein [Cetobacterium sp. 8H]MBC2850866.1 hypothetical protein [Cetobacterium sp. 8H]